MGGVVYGIVLVVAQWGVSSKGIMRAMPVILESCGTLLEDLTASLWTDDVIAQAEVFM